MTHEQCACKQLKTVVFGQRPDQTDGLLAIGINSAQTLHGTPDNPGGLVKQVQEIEELAVRKAKEEAAIAIALAREVKEMADNRLRIVEARQAFHNKIIYMGIGIGIALKLAWEAFQYFHK